MTSSVLVRPPVPAALATLERPSHLSLVNRPGVVTVRVVGTDPITDAGLRTQLQSRPDVQVVTTGDAQVVLGLTDSIDGRCLHWLREAAARHFVVLLAGRVDDAGVEAARAAGASGVIGRSEATPQRLAYLLRAARRERPRPGLASIVTAPVVTDRERQVLRLVAQGLSTREIAESLCYSERTIKNVLQDLTTRLGLRNRSHAVAHAVRSGWI